MGHKHLVKEIVKTYDLSPKLEDKIIRIASRRIEELFIDGFDNIYEYIGRLIDIFKTHRDVRLDSSIKTGGETIFYEMIGRRDVSLQLLLEENLNEENIMSIRDVLEALDGKLDKLKYTLLLQFINSNFVNKTGIKLSLVDLLSSIPKIQSRLEDLSKRYKFNGRLILPARDIKTVKFDPLSIKFKRRCYNGNPLAFFKKNKDKYIGMSRGRLYRLDPALYDSLYKYDQLKLAIPKVREYAFKPLSNEQTKKIIDAYKVYKGNAAEVERRLGNCSITIRKIWRSAGLKIKGRTRLSKEQIGEIINSYDKFNGSTNRAARKLGYSPMTVLRHWKKEGFKTREIKRLSEEQIEKIINSYEICNGNPTRIARYLNSNKTTVSRHLRKRGLELREYGKSDSSLSEKEIEGIIESHLKFNGNAARSARELGYCKPTIIKYWRQNNLKAIGNRRYTN